MWCVCELCEESESDKQTDVATAVGDVQMMMTNGVYADERTVLRRQIVSIIYLDRLQIQWMRAIIYFIEFLHCYNNTLKIIFLLVLFMLYFHMSNLSINNN